MAVMVITVVFWGFADLWGFGVWSFGFLFCVVLV